MGVLWGAAVWVRGLRGGCQSENEAATFDAVCGKNKVSDGWVIYKGRCDFSRMREHKMSNLGVAASSKRKHLQWHHDP